MSAFFGALVQTLRRRQAAVATVVRIVVRIVVRRRVCCPAVGPGGVRVGTPPAAAAAGDGASVLADADENGRQPGEGQEGGEAQHAHPGQFRV